MYQCASQKMKEKFGIEVTALQCKNQIRHQRTVWNHIQELKRKAGVSWNETNKIIVMGLEEFASHIQAFPKDVVYLNIPITNYVELEKVYSIGHATGEWAKSGNSQIPIGTEEIRIRDDELSQFMDDDADVSIFFESSEVKVAEDSRESTKRPLFSSGVRGVTKKKGKTSATIQSIHENICLMADSVAKVADVIECSTKSSQERRMFTELTAELASISGFLDEKTDIFFS